MVFRGLRAKTQPLTVAWTALWGPLGAEPEAAHRRGCVAGNFAKECGMDSRRKERGMPCSPALPSDQVLPTGRFICWRDQKRSRDSELMSTHSKHRSPVSVFIIQRSKAWCI